MSRKEVCKELKAIGMSDKKIARIVFGDADEFTVIMVQVLTTTAVQSFFEKLFEYEDDFRAMCFINNHCRPLVIE